MLDPSRALAQGTKAASNDHGAAPALTCRDLIFAEIVRSQASELTGIYPGPDPLADPIRAPARWTLPPGGALIATLPDVDKTPAGEAFDGALEAIVSGMESIQYVRDHAHLPRARPGKENQLYAQHCPGLMLFRLQPGASVNDSDRRYSAFAVLTVAENWHSGIDKRQFRFALQLATPDATRKLPILGPYYSASARGFIDSLRERCLEPMSPEMWNEACTDGFVAASGSMSSDAAVDDIKRNLSGLTYTTFASTQWQRKRALHEWRMLVDPGQTETIESYTYSPAPDYVQRIFTFHDVAALRLQGTTFGLPDPARSAASATSVTRAEPPARAPPTDAAKFAKFSFARELIFPGNLSALRKASDAAKGPTPEKVEIDEAHAEDWELIAWREPDHSSQVFRAGIHQAISRLPANINTVWISNERIEDASYLARLLKQEAPDLRVIIDRRDLALLRDDYAQELHGTLVVSTYPKIDDPQQNYTLTRDQAFGVYHALRWLAGPHTGPEPSEPKPQLEVIAGGRLIPLTRMNDVRNIPSAFLGVLVLFAVIAFADFARLFQISRRPSFWAKLTRIQGCTRSTLAPAYAVMFTLARCALAFGWIQLSALVYSAWPQYWQGSGWFQGVILGAHCAAGGCIVLTAISAGRLALGIPSRVQLLTLLGVWAAFLVPGACIWKAIQFASTTPAFLARSLDFFCGASPTAITVLCSVILYSVSAFSARRLRVLDRTGGTTDRILLGEALIDVTCAESTSNSNAPPIGTRLYRAATLRPNILRVSVAAFALLLLVAGVAPSNAWKPGSFTLECEPLHSVMLTGLILVAFAIVWLINQSWSVFRCLSELLDRLAVSDLFDAFKQVAWPRTVTQHLWVNWPEAVELLGALKVAGLPSKDADRHAFDAAYDRLIDEVHQLGKRLERSERSHYANGPRAVLAGLLAFELASWVRQLTTLMTSVTIATSGLLACSSLYVFGARRLMITISALLTVGAIIVSMVMFTSLEHDEVLRRMGTGSQGGPVLHPTWQRVLTYGVLPLLLLLTTYYPGIWSHLLAYVKEFLPGAK